MSNTQSIDSLRELNVKLLAEITELRKKFAEIESENAEIPELRKENAKLRAELKTRVAKLEQDFEHQHECDNISPKETVDIPSSSIADISILSQF